MIPCAWIGVLQAIGIALLQKFHLVEFSPVIDAMVNAASASACVAGAAVLRKSEPPIK